MEMIPTASEAVAALVEKANGPKRPNPFACTAMTSREFGAVVSASERADIARAALAQLEHAEFAALVTALETVAADFGQPVHVTALLARIRDAAQEALRG